MKKLLRSVFVFVLAFSLVLGTGAFTNVGTINVNAATAQVRTAKLFMLERPQSLR